MTTQATTLIGLPPKPSINDFLAGSVVFLVALPLCLGIALASQAPIVAGLLSGIIGGIVVGALSGSHTSVSGPAAGLTAVIAVQIATLGSFKAFLMAVVICGIIQIIMGLMRAGFIAAFFPSSVINGLLTAIGLILILKQLPHLVGWDSDFEGEMSFFQHDHKNTFSEIIMCFFNWHYGALIIGVLSLSILIVWGKNKFLKKSLFPAQLAVVICALIINYLFADVPFLSVGIEHKVSVPVFSDLSSFMSLFLLPDFTMLNDPRIYLAGLSLAIVASLETLLNLEAVDKIDPKGRKSPPNRELIAQGIGNLLLGFIGGLPLTSVIVRSSVNINARSDTKNSAMFHGILLLVCVLGLPGLLNSIPLSCLAAILIVTGTKLVNIQTIKDFWRQGLNQFIPFAVTVLAILFSDLLIGLSLGLCSSLIFILKSHFEKPLSVITEQYFNGEIIRINLANQVSFLNRASLLRVLDDISDNKTVIIDATNANYIDADILDIIDDFKRKKAVLKNINLSLVGFEEKYGLKDEISFQDHADLALQRALTSREILQAMKEGNARFREGKRLPRDLNRQILATSKGQFPLAVTLSCIDSRAPVELVFDLGIGDIFSIRLAGNVVSERVLGSLEFACSIAGAKLIVVMGHTKCGAVSAALELYRSSQSALDAYGCQHLDHLMSDIQKSIKNSGIKNELTNMKISKAELETIAVKANVIQSINIIKKQSKVVAELLAAGKIDLVGCVYDVSCGKVDFIDHEARYSQELKLAFGDESSAEEGPKGSSWQDQ